MGAGEERGGGTCCGTLSQQSTMARAHENCCFRILHLNSRAQELGWLHARVLAALRPSGSVAAMVDSGVGIIRVSWLPSTREHNSRMSTPRIL